MKHFDCSIRVFEHSVTLKCINTFHSFQPHSKKARYHSSPPSSADRGGSGFIPLTPYSLLPMNCEVSM